MNKSTPINQLPANNQPINSGFVNDQQRQITMQAQQAIISSSMPQNTQSNIDVSLDDDSAIQDILNQINASSSLQQEQPSPQQVQQQMQQQMQQQHLMNYNINTLQQPQPNLDHLIVQNVAPEMNYKGFFNAFADDIKLATLVFSCVVFAHFVQIDKYIGRYFAVDRIPYHHVLFRALLVAVLVLLVKKFVLKTT